MLNQDDIGGITENTLRRSEPELANFSSRLWYSSRLRYSLLISLGVKTTGQFACKVSMCFPL